MVAGRGEPLDTSPTTFAECLAAVQAGGSLSREQCRAAFDEVMTGRVSEEALAELLTLLARRGETVDEIAGAADALNAHVTRVPCPGDAVDTCGTGGDGINTFNASTAAAIIAAGAGALVAKHGNHTNTRVSGSADAVAQLGVNLEASVEAMTRCLRECNIAFLHAPRLHPAMRYAAPVRRRLGIRTIFNLIGPMANPAGVRRNLMGTCRPELVEKLGRVLAQRGETCAWVVRGEDGLGDLTITGPTLVTQVRGAQIDSFTVHPSEVGFQTAPLESLLVDSPAASAALIRAILDGREAGPARRHALLNAGATLLVAGLAANLGEGVALAAEALDSGKAARTLADLCRLSHS